MVETKSPKPKMTPKAAKFTLKATLARFTENQTTDVAASLTYFTVQTVFPALLALVSILQLIGQSEAVMPSVIALIEESVQDAQASHLIVSIVTGFLDSPGAGIALVTGILVALWSASSYVAAFSRALNRVYRVAEGRNIIRLKLRLFAVTIVMVLTMVVVLILMSLSGDFAAQVGAWTGIGARTGTLVGIAKWPLLLFMLTLMVGVLYHFCPNICRNRIRWLSAGSVTAVVVALIAVAGYGFYLSNFSNYNKTYGTLAGVIIALLLFWVTNIALLLGATLDAELERTRQLLLGLPAERQLITTPRDTTGLRAQKEQADRLADLAHEIRLGN